MEKILLLNRDMSKLKWIIGALLLLVFAGAVYWFWIQNHITSRKKISLPPAAFHADSVRDLYWETPDGKFQFSRKSVKDSWAPLADPQTLQSRILFLTQAHREVLEPIPKFSDGRHIVVSLKLSNGQIHQGRWRPGLFVWTDGPLRGQGAHLEVHEQFLFMAGMLAFEDRKVEWCRDRIVSADLNHSGEQHTIQLEKSNWVGIDSTFMERWMGEACTLLVDSWIDPKFILIPPIFESTAVFKFADQHWYRFDYNSKSLIRYVSSENKDQSVYLTSDRMHRALEAIQLKAQH